MSITEPAPASTPARRWHWHGGVAAIVATLLVILAALLRLDAGMAAGGARRAALLDLYGGVLELRALESSAAADGADAAGSAAVRAAHRQVEDLARRLDAAADPRGAIARLQQTARAYGDAAVAVADGHGPPAGGSTARADAAARFADVQRAAIGAQAVAATADADALAQARRQAVTLAAAAAVIAVALLLALVRGVQRERAAEAATVATSRIEERFRALTEQSSDIVWTLDAAGLVHYASPSAARMLGRETIGETLWELAHAQDAASLRRFVQLLKRHPNLPQTVECRCLTLDGRAVDLEVVGRNLLDHHDVSGLVLTARDVTERNRTAERLRHDALHDRLTGLPNRTLLLERIEAALGAADETTVTFAIAYVDLDGFKSVNDVYGHSAGDELLRLVATRLASVLRIGDRQPQIAVPGGRPPGTDTLARIGGDEFVVLLNHVAHPSHAVRAAERMQEALQAPFLVCGREVRIGASVGISMGPQAYARGEELLRDADIAMYRAKTSGQPHPQLFDQAMHDAMAERLSLENELRAALERHEFVLYFQPIVANGSQVLRGFEALVRWNHPTRGLLTPTTFLEAAETTRLILPLGRWVIREACRQVAKWRLTYPDLPAGVMSVNLSALETVQPDILEHLRQVLDDTGVPGRYLKLELTESVAMRDPAAAIELCRRIRAEQISVGVDDFGTGYCSLAYLRRLDIDFLKVDKSLVQDAATSSRSASILEATVAMAKALRLDVVFEGLETADHARMLARFDRALLQGYLLGRPMPEADTWAWLERLAAAPPQPLGAWQPRLVGQGRS